MRKFSKKKYLAVGAAAVIVASGAGVAFAYWTTSGSGSGTATTSGGTANLTVAADSTPSGLEPGSTPQSLGATVTNNQSNGVHVDSVTVSIADVKKGGVVAPACSSGDFTITNAGLLTNADPTDIAAGGSRDYTGATIAFNNTNANQDGCKSVTVDLSYVVNSA